MTDDYVRVGAVAEIPEGEMRAYDLDAARVTVAHVEYRFFAFGDECTHAGCPLSEGTFDDRASTVTCMCHDSVFDVETGEPLSGPAQDPVPVFGVREVDGWIEISAEPGSGMP